MRVLFVLSELGTGGAAVVHRLLADRLSEMGTEVDVFSFNPEDWENIYGTYPREKIIFQKDMTLTELLCRRNYDIIHGASDTPDRGLERSLKLSRSRALPLLTCHGFELPRASIDFVRLMIVVSNNMATELQASIQIPVRMIHNGIDESIFQPGPAEKPDKPVVLWVGRPYDVRKDAIGFTALASALMHYDVDVWVVIACPTDYPFSLAEWLPDNVQVLQNLSQKEMSDVYRATAASGGCTVSTSISEGLSLSMLEAMACGCPVVAPAVGGITDFLNGGNGCVYPRPISASKLREIVLNLIADTIRRESIISEGLKTVAAQFTSAKMAERYVALYSELLDKSSNKMSLLNTAARRITGTLCRLKART